MSGGAPDLARMRRERTARLRGQMESQGLDALLLLGVGNGRFAAGVRPMPADAARCIHQRTAVLLPPGGDPPHVFTPLPESAPPELPTSHVHPPLGLETPAGVVAAARRLGDALGGPVARLGVDEHTPASWLGLGPALRAEIADAGPALAAAKLCKSADEIACIRRAQGINEAAMLDVRAVLRPGLRPVDLSALFFERIFELGATGNGIDPIWQVMPASLAEGTPTLHGDVAFPTCTTDRILREGDVLWIDTGIDYEGYASDFGRTWIASVDPQPDARQREQFRRWKAVVDAVLAAVRPGTSGLDLCRIATEAAGIGRRPWPAHFYLIHGIGTEPAEMPLIGTDLGDAFDESVVLASGMVLVLEPAIWDDGRAGYRAEEIVAVTDDGFEWLSGHPYAPFEEAAP